MAPFLGTPYYRRTTTGALGGYRQCRWSPGQTNMSYTQTAPISYLLYDWMEDLGWQWRTRSKEL